MLNEKEKKETKREREIKRFDIWLKTTKKKENAETETESHSKKKIDIKKHTNWNGTLNSMTRQTNDKTGRRVNDKNEGQTNDKSRRHKNDKTETNKRWDRKTERPTKIILKDWQTIRLED